MSNSQSLPIDLLREGDRIRINFDGPVHVVTDVRPTSTGIHVLTTVRGVFYGATWFNGSETVRVLAG